MGAKYTDAQRAATNKYRNKKPFDRLNITVPKGELDKIKAYAESKGESVNGLVNRLLKQEMGE